MEGKIINKIIKQCSDPFHFDTLWGETIMKGIYFLFFDNFFHNFYSLFNVAILPTQLPSLSNE